MDAMPHQQVHCLLPANSHVASNLLVTADTEAADSVLGLGEDGDLARKLLKNLRSSKTAKMSPSSVHDPADAS